MKRASFTDCSAAAWIVPVQVGYLGQVATGKFKWNFN